MISLDTLQAFIAFAETRSFTHGARRVSLSQPALHEKIKKLAAELEVPLYEKNGREISLTLQGNQLLAFARDSLSRTHDFVTELRGEAKREIAVLAAGEGAFLYLLGPAIERFHRREKATLRLLTLGGPAALEAVQRGEAHLAVGVVD